MRLLPFALSSLLAFASSPASAEDTPAAEAPATSTCSVAVLDLQAQGLPADQAHVARILTDSVATELSSVTDCRVITQADIASMLDLEAQKMACDTEAASCLAEIGGALGVARVVAGSVGKLGSSFTVQLKLIDIVNAQVLKRVELTVAGDAEQLRFAAKNGARQLYDAAPLEGTETPNADDPAATSGGLASSPFLWAGVGLLAVGLVGATAGGVAGLYFDSQLGEAAVTNKSGVQTLGLVSVGAGAVGGVVALVGAGLLPLAFLE